MSKEKYVYVIYALKRTGDSIPAVFDSIKKAENFVKKTKTDASYHYCEIHKKQIQ